MAVSHPRSDVEIIARTRILIASVVIYLLTVAFMALGDRLYAGSDYLVYSRLAALPFFALLLIRWVRLVRVRPPRELLEARRLVAMNRLGAARTKLEALRAGPLPTRRIDRARRLLQDGLAVPVADEILLEIGRCSLLLGQLDRAIEELGRAWERLPVRADVAIDLADAFHRAGKTEQAAATLRQGLAFVDAVDLQTLGEQPALMRLLGDARLPTRSAFWRRIQLERCLLGLLLAAAAVHGMHLYLGLF